jgi:hypothetical protein
VAFAEWDGNARQSSGTRTTAERLSLHVDGGRTSVDNVRRLVVRGGLGASGFGLIPLSASFAAGRMTGSTLAFEQFSAGGLASPLVDSSLTEAQLPVPALPNGALRNRESGDASTLYEYRISAPMGWLAPYYEAVSVGSSAVPDWHRVAGIEARIVTGPIPQAYLPGLSVVAGVARSFDAPWIRSTAYAELRIQP